MTTSSGNTDDARHDTPNMPAPRVRVIGGFEEFTDGVFQWPEGLAHYVLEHSVRLPAEVVQHAIATADAGSAVGRVDAVWWLDATS